MKLVFTLPEGGYYLIIVGHIHPSVFAKSTNEETSVWEYEEIRSSEQDGLHAFFYKQHFYKQPQAKIGKN